jgi:hypothetical protein
MRTAGLALLYYLVVTPIGAVTRLVRDPLTRRPSHAPSYWTAPR